MAQYIMIRYLVDFALREKFLVLSLGRPAAHLGVHLVSPAPR